MLEALLGERRFALGAAFAYAKRRETDPDMRAAADLLEVTVAARDGQLGRPKWWQRSEVVFGGMSMLHAVNVTLSLSRALGWWAVVWVLGLFAVTVALVLVWQRRVRSGRVGTPPAPGEPASAGRIFEITNHILARSRAQVAEGCEDVEVLAREMASEARRQATGPVGPLLALGALSHAARVLQMSMERGRGPVRAAALLARDRLHADLEPV